MAKGLSWQTWTNYCIDSNTIIVWYPTIWHKKWAISTAYLSFVGPAKMALHLRFIIPHFICCASTFRLFGCANAASSPIQSRSRRMGRMAGHPCNRVCQLPWICRNGPIATPSSQWRNLSPLCLSLKSSWRQWLAFQSSKAVTVWTVLSLRGWSSWSSSEGSSRKVFFTMALLQDEPWPCCNWRGWWMMVGPCICIDMHHTSNACIAATHL